MSTVSELMMYVGIGLVVILAWGLTIIWACKVYEWWQNDPRWSRAVAYIYEGRSYWVRGPKTISAREWSGWRRGRPY